MFMAKPGFFKRSPLKFSKSYLTLQAKALHRQLNEAIAAGDRMALREVAAHTLAQRLITTVDRRPRDAPRKAWELVQYTGRVRIVDFKFVPQPGMTLAFVQAVVAIPSKQRLTEYDGEGATKERAVNQTDYVCMMQVVDFTTYKELGWKILAVLPEQKAEQVKASWELMKDMMGG
jgi:mitochondrial protein MBA1